MNYENALLEIKKIQDTGVYFKYDFDHNVMNKYMFCIEIDGYSIKDIVSKLEKDEKLLILINDGYMWNGKMDNNSKMILNEKYENSIYWEHQRGDCIRIDSDKGSIKSWCKILDKKYSV